MTKTDEFTSSAAFVTTTVLEKNMSIRDGVEYIAQMQPFSNPTMLSERRVRLRSPWCSRHPSVSFLPYPLSHGSTLNVSLTPILASSTSRYFNTPGTATIATLSPPVNLAPCPSCQMSVLASSPLAG